MKKSVFLLGLILTASFIGIAAPLKIELPMETAVYKTGPGSDLANAQCLTCHSAEYVTTQPPLPRAFWKGSVDKMIGKYGAPIPSEQIDPLVDYLARTYGTETTNAAPSATVAVKEPSPSSLDPQKLAIRTGCFNCHNAEQKIIGPSFKAVAEKYKGKPDGLSKISHQITHGGSGLWGPIPMPPFKQLSDTEVKALSAWILNRQ